MMGRMKPGISQYQAQAGLKMISPKILQERGPLGWGSDQNKSSLAAQFSITSGAQGWTSLRTRFSNPLAILMALVGLVLLVAGANLANLLLARKLNIYGTLSSV